MIIVLYLYILVLFLLFVLYIKICINERKKNENSNPETKENYIDTKYHTVIIPDIIKQKGQMYSTQKKDSKEYRIKRKETKTEETKNENKYTTIENNDPIKKL